jgi:glutathione S-transferase
VAILTWIARQYPAARLLPESGMNAIRALSFLAWCASGVHPTLSPQARPERYCDLPDSAPGVRRCAAKLTREAYQVAEDLLGGRDGFFDGFTAADIYFYWSFRMGGILRIDQSDFPGLGAHKARMEQRPAVKQALAFEAEQMAVQKNGISMSGAGRAAPQ